MSKLTSSRLTLAGLAAGVVLAFTGPVAGAQPSTRTAATPVPGESDASGVDKDKGYTIEKPGTITFTVGIKIKGKVEKPQVVIFLPKEKPVFRQVSLTHSFADQLQEPLPFVAGVP